MRTSRLDVALVQLGLVGSRERAQAAIAAGMVRVNDAVATKPASRVSERDQLSLTGDPIGFVGRGGLKLKGALDHFAIDVRGRICLDVGSSTGGFADCLLQRGAKRVYAVDVGRDQLHARLRADPRVVVMEGTDIRTLGTLPEPPTLAAVDVSFISLTLVIPAIAALMGPGALILVLIKPQFEGERGRVGKKGIVKDPKLHQAAILRVVTAALALGLRVGEVLPSPIQGSDGNQEFLTTFQT